ncbi:MAG TPA: metallopeptidase [Euryarchaeota archaeon]|nr:metallopeptidase [Euryarchaeota archaeon]
MRYEQAPDVRRLAVKIAEKTGMDWLDFSRIHFVRTRGSKSRAVARVRGLPKVFQKTLGIPAHYVIEVIAERFDRLHQNEKEKIIIHELLHIPKSMGGGYRHHDYVTAERVEMLWKAYRGRGKIRF